MKVKLLDLSNQDEDRTVPGRRTDHGKVSYRFSTFLLLRVNGFAPLSEVLRYIK